MLSSTAKTAIFGISAIAFCCAVACSTTVTSTGPFGTLDGGPSQDGSSNNSGNNGSGICAAFCEKAASANCSSQSSCGSDCEKQIDSTPDGCKEAVEKLIECGGSEGTFDGCTSDGKPKMKGCDDETMAYLQCLQSGGKPDGGSGSGGDLQKCGQVTTGEPACDACMDTSCCAEETECFDEPDCEAFYVCYGQTRNVQTCQAQHPTGYALALKSAQCMDAKCSTQCQ